MVVTAIPTFDQRCRGYLRTHLATTQRATSVMELGPAHNIPDRTQSLLTLGVSNTRTASPSYRHSAHYQRASHSASRHSSSAGLSPSKLPRSAPMNDANGDAPRPKSGKKSEQTRRRRRTRNSGTKRDTRAIDYGLGLLDDPFFLGGTSHLPICNTSTDVDAPQIPPQRHA